MPFPVWLSVAESTGFTRSVLVFEPWVADAVPSGVLALPVSSTVIVGV